MRTVWVMPVASPYDSREARLTASVLAGPSMNPIPAPARTMYHMLTAEAEPVTFPAQSQNPMAPSVHPSATGRFAPRRSSIRPPIWAATTKPAKKHSSRRLACEGVLPSEIWAYSLAKKNTGTNTSIETPSTRFSTKNGRIRKMSTWISGEVVRASTKKNTTRSTAPMAMHAPVAGLLQPQIVDCWKPNTLSATPDAIRTRPR